MIHYLGIQYMTIYVANESAQPDNIVSCKLQESVTSRIFGINNKVAMGKYFISTYFPVQVQGNREKHYF